MKKLTNWQQYYQAQMRHPATRRLVEAELKALRVGVQLAKLRERKGFSQTELAARAGMSGPNISRIETSPGQNLTLGTLVKVAGALGYEPHVTFRPRRMAVARR